MAAPPKVTNNPETDARLVDPYLRAIKLQQTLDVMSACFDILNDDINAEEFLGAFARLASCGSVLCAWWSVGQPESLKVASYGPTLPLPANWPAMIEAAILAANPTGPVLQDDLFPAGTRPPAEMEPLLTENLLIACVDTAPARVILVFGNREVEPQWQAYDREKLRLLLPVVRKSVTIKKHLSAQLDRAELTENILDAIPRGLITLLPNAEIIMTNSVAEQIMRRGEHVRQRNEKLVLGNPGLQQELLGQLKRIRNLPPTEISDFVWHRNLSDSVGAGSCMATMLAFAFQTWRTESIAFDRVAVMILQTDAMSEAPSAAQIREFYQVTKAQARLIVALMRGATIDDAAIELKVSINTVRSHLRAIYGRLGVGNKAQLLQKVGTTITNSVRNPSR